MGVMRFVGVGPGDPELLTRKAVRAIWEADCIAVPDSGMGRCVVLDIASEWVGEKPILRLPMPMQGAAPDWQEAHAQAAQMLEAELAQGRSVAYLVLGDPSLYASSGYLLRRIKAQYPCEVVAGVPAICEAAARLGIPLAEGRAPLSILPGYTPGDAIPDGNVVIMKAGKHLEALRGALEERPAFVAQNLGMPEEVLGTLQDSRAGNAYLTTVIVQARKSDG